MQLNRARWSIVLALMMMLFAWPVPTSQGQSGGSGGGSGGGMGSAGTGGGSGLGGGTGPGGSGMGRPVVPRSKSPDGNQLNPQLPGGPSQQRDRAQRLEQQLREGQVNPTTPQTEMSDRLDQLYKKTPSDQSGTR